MVVKDGTEVTRKARVCSLCCGLGSVDPARLWQASLADRVIGKAAAFLAVKGGMTTVYSPVMSEPAVAVLEQHGVEVHYEVLVENIMGQRPGELCLMEQMVAEISEPGEAFRRLAEFFQNQGVKLSRGGAE